MSNKKDRHPGYALMRSAVKLIKPPMIFSKEIPIINKKKIIINYPELTVNNKKTNKRKNKKINNPRMVFSIKEKKQIKFTFIDYPIPIIKKKNKKLNHPPMVFSVKEIKKRKKPYYTVMKKCKKKKMINKKIKVHDFVDNFLLAYDDNYHKKKNITKEYVKNLVLYNFKELVTENEYWDDTMNIEKNDILKLLFHNLSVVYSIRVGWFIGNINFITMYSLEGYMKYIFCKKGEEKHNEYLDNYHLSMYYSKKRLEHSYIFKNYIWEELCKKVFHPKYNNILWNIDED